MTDERKAFLLHYVGGAIVGACIGGYIGFFHSGSVWYFCASVLAVQAYRDRRWLAQDVRNSRLAAYLRKWWARRSTLSIQFAPEQDVSCVVNGASTGEYSIGIGDEVTTIRVRWWDTRPSIAWRFKRALRAKGVVVK